MPMNTIISINAAIASALLIKKKSIRHKPTAVVMKPPLYGAQSVMLLSGLELPVCITGAALVAVASLLGVIWLIYTVVGCGA